QLARDRRDRGPLGRVLGAVLADHPHGALAYFGRVLTRSCHGLHPLNEWALRQTRYDSVAENRRSATSGWPGVFYQVPIETPNDSALQSRRRAVGLLPSLGLLENGAGRRPPRGGRVRRRHRLGHGDLHRHQRRAAAAAALPEQRALRVAVRREDD